MSNIQKTRVDVLKSMMNSASVQEQFKNALGESANLFIASMIDMVGSDSKLQQCDSKELIKEALKAAVLKLPINKSLGFAYIIPFNVSVKKENGAWERVVTPTFIIGYKGFIQLAMRTGEYRYLNADVVYEGELNNKSKLTGEIDISGEATSDKIVGYFCHFVLRNGFTKTLYMSVEQMARYAKMYSPSLKNSSATVEQLIALANSPATGKIGWEGDFTAMALKTVTRNLLSKYGILSIEMQTALTNDHEVENQEPETPRQLIPEATYEEVQEPTNEQDPY